MLEDFHYNNRTFITKDIISCDSGIYKRTKGYINPIDHNYLDNIQGYIMMLTNDPNFLKHLEDYLPTGCTTGTICLCGCDLCSELFTVCHLPSKTYFGVGSTCIRKFMGKRCTSILEKINNKDLCNNCNECLFFKKTKFFERNAFKNEPGFCHNCWIK